MAQDEAHGEKSGAPPKYPKTAHHLKAQPMTPIVVSDKVRPMHPFKLCNKCEEKKPPEGGIELGAKWICHPCWINRNSKKGKK